MTPSKSEFLSQTGHTGLRPIYRDILADVETPLSAYWKLSHDEPYSFLLESVTGGEQLARYSILGVRPRTVLRSKDTTVRRITAKGETRSTIPEGSDPLEVLKQEIPHCAVIDGLPKFIGGAIGMFSYDLVRFFEKLPQLSQDDMDVDDLAMMITEAVVVFDHAKNLIRIFVLAEPTSEGYDRATAEIERIVARLRRPLPDLPSQRLECGSVTANMDRETYEAGVERIKDYIAAGDGIQMVLSQRFSTRLSAHPISVYRALRSINPSPYMFLLSFGEFQVIGASPELLVSLEGDTARVRPIAGTRWRGTTADEDRMLAAELLADEKERAEHIMLVDLGRNDLGRVCEYGSVKVNELMEIERYSHVMHIVSDVTGSLRSGLSGIDLIRATFPAGTVSGAPKVRAMEIIEELEPTRRGFYAGSVGYLSATGDLDLAIAIRTLFTKDGVVYCQAGAGIVHDSVPSKEYEECINKAKASMRAIELAHQGFESI